MDTVLIYGILNEDREIVFISDFQYVEWNPDGWIEDDADWKFIKLNDSDLMDEVDGIHWGRNVVILERLNIDDENIIKQSVNNWIDIINPKYVLEYISPADLMTFRTMKEREWEEEDKMLLQEDDGR